MQQRQTWDRHWWPTDGFQGHVAGPLHGPLVVLFEQDGATEPREKQYTFWCSELPGFGVYVLTTEAIQTEAKT
jgi:hypothetical protein